MNTVNVFPTWLFEQKQTAFLPDWLQEKQAEQEQALQTTMPSRHDERWKYTDLSLLTKYNFKPCEIAQDQNLAEVIHQHKLRSGDSVLIVTVNGCFMPELSELHHLPAGLRVCSLEQALQTHSDLVKQHWPFLDAKAYPFAAINLARNTQGLFFHLAEGVSISPAIHLLNLHLGEAETQAATHCLFILDKQAQMTVAEEYYSHVDQAYFKNALTTVALAKQAKLEYCKIQKEGQQAIHMANTFVYQEQDSRYQALHFSEGAIFSRDDVMIKLKQANAECKTAGFYFPKMKDQYVDFHIDVDHQAPRTNSEMLYKGILDNKSKSVFNGRLHVEKDAQKILAYQANHNLLLSNQAQVYSKPELEIYADDVKCKHGASTGQLDQEALFYLRSRGIPYQEAMTILLQGFSQEILQAISHPGIKMRVEEVIL